MFLYLKKDFLCEEDLIHKIISCFMNQTRQTTIYDLLYFKDLHALKKSDMYIKTQNPFLF